MHSISVVGHFKERRELGPERLAKEAREYQQMHAQTLTRRHTHAHTSHAHVRMRTKTKWRIYARTHTLTSSDWVESGNVVACTQTRRQDVCVSDRETHLIIRKHKWRDLTAHNVDAFDISLYLVVSRKMTALPSSFRTEALQSLVSQPTTTSNAANDKIENEFFEEFICLDSIESIYSRTRKNRKKTLAK